MDASVDKKDLKNCELPRGIHARIVSNVFSEGFNPDCCIAWYMVMT
jgi:hypothetical protein